MLLSSVREADADCRVRLFQTEEESQAPTICREAPLSRWSEQVRVEAIPCPARNVADEKLAEDKRLLVEVEETKEK